MKSLGEQLCECWQAVAGPSDNGEALSWGDWDEDQQGLWNRAAERFSLHLISQDLSEAQRRVLVCIAENGSDEYAFGFGYICSDTGLDRARVRAACRALSAKGLVHFMRGLMNEDGMLAGSGYGCTRLGIDVSGRLA